VNFLYFESQVRVPEFVVEEDEEAFCCFPNPNFCQNLGDEDIRSKEYAYKQDIKLKENARVKKLGPRLLYELKRLVGFIAKKK
jgi:hypothetical protein